MQSKRVGFGVIGVGLWGETHCEVYSSHPLSELVAVCDISEQRAKDMAQKYRAKRYYTDFNRLLEDDDVQAVGIATPDFLHYEPVMAAVRAKKHINVEKPLSTSIREAKEMVEAAEAAGIKLMVDFHNRWNPGIFKAKEAIDKGELGKPMLAYIRLNDTIMVPTEMLRWAARSNVVWFVGSHAIDAVRWLFSDEVKRVYSVKRSEVLYKLGVDTPDFYESVLEFNGGGVAIIENCWILPNTQPFIVDFKMELICSNGAIYGDFTHNRILEKFTERRYEYPDLRIKFEVQGKLLGFARESISHFIECVAYDKEPIVKGEDGIKVTEIITAILKSADEGIPIEI